MSKREEPCERATLNERRSYLTHVAFVCDRADVQPLLPQFVVGNEHILPAGQMEALRALLPENVRLVRQKSSWNNPLLFAAMIRAMGATVKALAQDFQVILLFDAAPIHCPRPVFAACRTAGVWPVVVPARATWLLQPLDTHVFRGFKAALRRACVRERVLTADGRLAIAGLLRSLSVAVGEVLTVVDWSAALDHNGFGAAQAGASERVRDRVGGPGGLVDPAGRPTVAELQLCFPANRACPSAAVWSAFDAPLPAPVEAKASAARPAIAAALGPPSWGAGASAPPAPPLPSGGRAITRSMSRALAKAASAASAGASSSAAPSSMPP